ncbi:DNA cytosine methyltransferase [Planomicrobium sp. Y74]|uniref:DNA cytosine methyltransferase n=1 Tax=Planomicrobium sp. Y74 TaxID=2478977 RepID=UPI000EF516AA|nr:DNA cytosine methyltransferase [Planomicrobium sp. Y74]RLQ90218.1 DNA cytosine methyltransferase [Planomicrobium sp. Y74]
MNVIDLFAGAGGLSEGFRQAGYNIIAHIEMDKSACKTLRTREAYYYLKSIKKIDLYEDYLMKKISREQLYNMVPNDILDSVIESEISDENFPKITSMIDEQLSICSSKIVDIVIGGPPCQAFSSAGIARDPNRMKDDPRNYLYRQYIKFIIRYSPKFFIFENVKGILTAQKGNILKALQKELSNAGYHIDYRVLNAKDFGVSQNRQRVILIGWRKEYEFTYPDFIFPIQITPISELFNDLPPLRNGLSVDGEKRYRRNAKVPNSFIRPRDWKVLSQHITRAHNQNDLAIYNLVVENWNKNNKLLKYNELPTQLQTHNNRAIFLDRYKLVPAKGISHTVVAHIAKDGHYYIHPDKHQNRSISVREAARIQSFPDNFYFEDSRTAAFRQIGNAVPPLMSYRIAKYLKPIITDLVYP